MRQPSPVHPPAVPAGRASAGSPQSTPAASDRRSRADGQPGAHSPARFDLLPTEALEQIAQVLAHGAAKHGDRDWEQGIAWSRVFSAAMRHLWAWWNGEDKDQESGLSHLAHAASRLLFLLHYETSRREFDDRRSRKAAA